ncbi:hypothetical protein BWQ96_10435 [Gracilariopsis chorda]|uniref:Uncharacterized protein n=1 Tax=Gracilariopsis chorda TaxID=448386 RepID=A0A2V3ICN7_9FLOR|nr:hypothetical protein BWQ96_10435 [Gracilariopsis chorda]|eukprot:PXF39856.1 hypothetical protein BWQ96_10435 [Gracilariopsis chorda]
MTRRNNANATQNENSIVQPHSDQDIIDYLSCASPATKEKLREEAQISRKPITEKHVRSLVISEMETNKKEMENKIADGIENFSTSILAFIEVRLNDLEERLHARMNRSLSSMRQGAKAVGAIRKPYRGANSKSMASSSSHTICVFCDMKVGCFRHKKC